jgi:hypothetical protein
VFTIAIIGAGNLGSRHLQAVAQMTEAVKIYVVDVSQSSLDMAQLAYGKVPHDMIFEIKFIRNICQIHENIDVGIIATSSMQRKQAIKDLLNHIPVKYLILEKFLFPAIEDYDEITDFLAKKSCRTWVNCVRRMQPAYQAIKNSFQGESNIICSITGGNWGLGCNGIHMIDMLAFLLDDRDFLFDTKYLDRGYIDSKRQGYIEFTGTLTGNSKKCSFISLSSEKNSSHPPVILIQNKNVHCMIEESLGQAFISKREGNWAHVNMEFPILFQSQLTGVLVVDIMKNGTCRLPSYEESAVLHKSLLSVFLEHYNTNKDEWSSVCPIT